MRLKNTKSPWELNIKKTENVIYTWQRTLKRNLKQYPTGKTRKTITPTPTRSANATAQGWPFDGGIQNLEVVELVYRHRSRTFPGQSPTAVVPIRESAAPEAPAPTGNGIDRVECRRTDESPARSRMHRVRDKAKSQAWKRWKEERFIENTKHCLRKINEKISHQPIERSTEKTINQSINKQAIVNKIDRSINQSTDDKSLIQEWIKKIWREREKESTRQSVTASANPYSRQLSISVPYVSLSQSVSSVKSFKWCIFLASQSSCASGNGQRIRPTAAMYSATLVTDTPSRRMYQLRVASLQWSSPHSSQTSVGQRAAPGADIGERIPSKSKAMV